MRPDRVCDIFDVLFVFVWMLVYSIKKIVAMTFHHVVLADRLYVFSEPNWKPCQIDPSQIAAVRA